MKDEGFENLGDDVHVVDFDLHPKNVRAKQRKGGNTMKTEELLRIAERYAAEANGFKIDKFVGDVEIPRNLIVRVCGHVLNIGVQAKLAIPGQKLTYPEILKRELAAYPEMGDLYINGPQPGIKYYLSGNGAARLIASLQG